ncbi:MULTISPECIES: UPF0149 family protein [Gammaproteobacteria]|uniref:UPF0149 family protein n=1 Tax=Gammaproteobacteria TaxID=1236 RepID=UPI000DD0D118|nr:MULTISPECIES: UPF0149 family protein [Gammaproteobacteria]RTE85527.1 YecA family protein [Aliidiomarina sp. B3213]TCZ89497.1 YecA family protein [Lysobacter sp. N42]
MAEPISKLFETWNQWLEREGMITSAAELHGMLTGLMASGQQVQQSDWLNVVADLAHEGQAFSAQMNERLETLGRKIREDLASAELNFQLLVPGDEELLSERLKALAEWTQCFLVGFGVNQQNLKAASNELREGIEDMAEIAKLSPEMEGDEEDERAFYEVSEYVRITAIMCFNELGQVANPTPPSSNTIH